MSPIAHRTIDVDGLSVFYREAGRRERTRPSAAARISDLQSHMFRDLIPRSSDRYHVIAPDLPGFGFTEAPDRASFPYTFDHLAKVIDRFTEVLSLNRYRHLRLRLRRADRLPHRARASRIASRRSSRRMATPMKRG